MLTHENTAKAQRKRILSYLHTKLNTFDARKELDVMHPAARVMELRNHTTPTDTGAGLDSKETDKQKNNTEVQT